jgi:hypothetical protein
VSFGLGLEGSTGPGWRPRLMLASALVASLGARRVVMNQDTRIILVALAFFIILFVAVFALTTRRAALVTQGSSNPGMTRTN